MNIKEIKKHIKTGQINQVIVTGYPSGDFVVTAILEGHIEPLTNTTNDRLKLFRSPKYVVSFLKEQKIEMVNFDISDWDISKVFDAHKRATELKKKNSTQVEKI